MESKPGGLRLAVAALGLGIGALMLAGSVAALTAKTVAYGRHLSGECSACHRVDGADNGIPSITGWRPEEFVATLVFYRNGERNNPAMVSVAQSLDDDQMAALAAYYGSLTKGQRSKR
jgi:cytochrome c553